MLAESWDLSGDYKQFKLNLRKGVRYHTGRELTSDDIKFNLTRILDPKVGTGQFVSQSKWFTSIETPDKYTAVLKSDQGRPLIFDFFEYFNMLDRETAEGPESRTKAAGTGPFTFVEWKRDDHLTLKKNPDYWGTKANLDTITYKPITDDAARAAGLKTGAYDAVRLLAGQDTEAARTDSNLTYKSIPGLAFGGFEVNHARAPFNDKAKVQAVAMAVDRAQVIKNVFFGLHAVSYGPIPPSSWAFDSSEKVYDKADPNKAKALATGFGFTLKVANTPASIQEGTLIKDQLARAGITATIQPEEFGQILTDTEAHNFDAALVGWSGRIDPDGNMYSWFHTGGGNNQGQYSNPDVDKALEDARITTDQAKRKQLYDQAQKLLVTDAAYIFINHQPAEQISTNKVHGYVLYPDGMPRLATVWKG
jgi:peptide/nickel transport system substrate-binding protein